jgi:hypothetical protein
LDVGSEETLQTIEPNSNEAAAVAEAIGIPVGMVLPRGGSRLVQVHSASEEHVGPGGETEDEVKVNGSGSKEVVAET